MKSMPSILHALVACVLIVSYPSTCLALSLQNVPRRTFLSRTIGTSILLSSPISVAIIAPKISHATDIDDLSMPTVSSNELDEVCI